MFFTLATSPITLLLVPVKVFAQILLGRLDPRSSPPSHTPFTAIRAFTKNRSTLYTPSWQFAYLYESSATRGLCQSEGRI